MRNEFYRGYAKIDMDAIEFNMDRMWKNLMPNTKMLAVVKTDGYGHGAVEIAHMLERKEYLAGYAVACLEEGIALRRNGIRKMILILGSCFEQQLETMLAYQITPSVSSLEMAEKISKTAVSMGIATDVHIKIDTGMGRIGFLPTEESIEEIVQISKLPGIRMGGIFTHFARADEANKKHARDQLRLFRGVIRQLKLQGVTFRYCHCSNSAGILDMPEANMDLVRAGITMYGLAPSEEVDVRRFGLRPALSLYSRVVHVKTVPAGVPISYGGTYVTERPTVVATIPMGYGDGYPRALSNKGSVLIRGQRAPIIGRVCMDQFMVDVTDIPGVACDDVVTLVGRDGGQIITVDELGELSGRFNYEFVCDIGKRVPRAYYSGEQMYAKRDLAMD